MKTLHLSLQILNATTAEVRYFTENPNVYQSRALLLSSIDDLIRLTEQDYYNRLPEEYFKTGQKLFNWLDGEERFLARALPEVEVVAIATSEKFAHLPWEVLADQQGFLIDRGIVPMRWLGNGSALEIEARDKPYELNLLLMATSPESETLLGFEQEETRIIRATERAGLQLVVEESGSLGELARLVPEYGRDHFDVFHLTGHATIANGTPVFVTETDEGDAHLATATEIVAAFGGQFPPVVFLSGCKSGQSAQEGGVASLSELLVQAGAGAVLGWGQSVLDADATVAAETLYGQLAQGVSLVAAIAATYQAMRQKECRDWHLLRVFVRDHIPGALVLPKRRRQPQPRMRFAEKEFLDPVGQTMQVASRFTFVGRRRPLQRCLRSLKNDFEKVGVWIHGMGGLGKSSLAVRICDRLPQDRVAIIGLVDEPRLVSALSNKLGRQTELIEILQSEKSELKFRLLQVLERVDRGILIVLDDFEFNLDDINQTHRMKPDVRRVVSALEWAIAESGREHRLIVTCRYELEAATLRSYYVQPLAGMDRAEFGKKRQQLSFPSAIARAEGEEKSRLAALQVRADRIAGGNPRLSEWLDKVLCETAAEDVLQALEESQAKFREDILAEKLLEMVSAETRSQLAHGRVFELPVPRVCFESVCGGVGLDRAIALGLMEVFPGGEVRVPRVLPLVLAEDEALAAQAARELYRVWYQEAERSTEEQRLEIHRLAMIGKVEEIAGKMARALASQWKNKSRFREAQKLCRETLEITQDFRVLHQLARSEEPLGETQSAVQHYQEALDSCPDSSDSEVVGEKAAIMHNVAGIYANQGQVNEAITLYQQSLALQEQIGNVQGKAATLHCMAIIYANQGQVNEAITLYQQSLALQEQIGNVQGKAATLHCMAIIYANQGQVNEAITLYQQSLALNEQIGNVQGKAATLHCMAIIYANQGQVNEAITLYQQSLALNEQIGDVQGKAATLHCMAIIYANQGQVNEAITLYQQSLALNEQIGDVQGKAASLHQMAGIYANQGQVNEAITLFQQSLALKEQIGDVQGKAASLHQMAIIYANQGQVNEAITLYQQSLALNEQIGDVQGKAATLHQMAGIYANQGQVNEAITLYQQSLALNEQIGNVQGKAMTLWWLGGIAQQQGEFEPAIAYLQESLQILQHIGSPDAAPVERLLANVMQMRQNES